MWNSHTDYNFLIKYIFETPYCLNIYYFGSNLEYSKFMVADVILLTHHSLTNFPDDTFKCIFLNENVWKLIKKSVPKGPINDISALAQIMAWRRSGDKPLSEPMIII